jgi:hypothetical protein
VFGDGVARHQPLEVEVAAQPRGVGGAGRVVRGDRVTNGLDLVDEAVDLERVVLVGVAITEEAVLPPLAEAGAEERTD